MVHARAGRLVIWDVGSSHPLRALTTRCAGVSREWRSETPQLFAVVREGRSGTIRGFADCVAQSLESLEVLQLANELRGRVLQLARRSVVRRDLRFAGQLTDAAASVSRNIAEGFGHVRPLEFARFLYIARGSLFELREQLSDGVARGYWTEDELQEARAFSKRTTGAINALIRYLRSEKARQLARQWEQIRGSTSDGTDR